MRRSRNHNIGRERIIMIASSVFVLAALTMAGFYMKDRQEKVKDDGYVIDFTAMEDSVDEKFEEIAQAEEEEYVAKVEASEGNLEDDLDYMPLEVGGYHIQIPGLTDQSILEELSEEAAVSDQTLPQEGLMEAEMETVEMEEEAATLHFAEGEGLIRPVAGEVLMHYSMDHSIYFQTLDQYKYNPATMFTASEGENVFACADGRVISVFEDPRLGQAMTLEIGDGYQVTYGQLANIAVSVDSYVSAGQNIATVAAPTKYFSLEGCNLYFQLSHQGQSVNPETFFDR